MRQHDAFGSWPSLVEDWSLSPILRWFMIFPCPEFPRRKSRCKLCEKYLSNISFSVWNFNPRKLCHPTNERIHEETESVSIKRKQFYVKLLWTGEHEGIWGLNVDQKLLNVLTSVTKNISCLKPEIRTEFLKMERLTIFVLEMGYNFRDASLKTFKWKMAIINIISK